jgi:hypothetical protein
MRTPAGAAVRLRRQTRRLRELQTEVARAAETGQPGDPFDRLGGRFEEAPGAAEPLGEQPLHRGRAQPGLEPPGEGS